MHSVGTRLLLLLAALPLCLVLVQAQAADDPLQAGIEARIAGDTQRAVNLLEQAYVAQPENPDLLLQLALAYRSQGRAERSADLIDKGLALAPEHGDLNVEGARLAIWRGESARARNILDATLAAYPEHAEALALRARLAIMTGDLERAESDLVELDRLSIQEAGTRLLRADLAWLRGDAARARELVAMTWQDSGAEPGMREACCDRMRRYRRYGLELGGGYGWLSDTPLSNWQEQRLQLSYRATVETDLWLRSERYERFDATDWQTTLGGSHSFSDSAWGWLELGATPGADFRPRWQAAAGGEWAPAGTVDALQSLTLLGRLQVSDYFSGTVVSGDAGARYWFTERTAVTAQANLTRDEGRDYNAGWRVRLDRRFTGAWRFYLGYANASDTQGAQTVTTSSWFAGAAVCVTPNAELFLDYDRDERGQGGYTRDGLAGGLRLRW